MEYFQYGKIHIHQTLQVKQLEGLHTPSEQTVYHVMKEIGISHKPKRKPNGITKADKKARKSDDLLKRNFKSDKPLKKCVTDMTEIKAIKKYNIKQSKNNAGGKCHDNVRCESMWASLKEELLYRCYDTSKITIDEIKTLIWSILHQLLE